jgi:hypothetical protein
MKNNLIWGIEKGEKTVAHSSFTLAPFQLSEVATEELGQSRIDQST